MGDGSDDHGASDQSRLYRRRIIIDCLSHNSRSFRKRHILNVLKTKNSLFGARYISCSAATQGTTGFPAVDAQSGPVPRETSKYKGLKPGGLRSERGQERGRETEVRIGKPINLDPGKGIIGKPKHQCGQKRDIWIIERSVAGISD